MKNSFLKIIDYISVYGELNFVDLGFSNSLKCKTLTFSERYDYLKEALDNVNITVIITTKELYKIIDYKTIDKSFIIVNNPRYEFWKLHNSLVESNNILIVDSYRGNSIEIHPTAYVEENTYIGDYVKIGPQSVILGGSIIGNNSVIHSNCTIGAEGLQTLTFNGNKIFIKHSGGVKIGKNVQILSNTVVSKAVDKSYTQIGDNSTISLLCSIGHNCSIGDNCSIAGNCLIGGSAKIGNNVWIGPSSTIKDSISIGNNAQIKLGSVVVKDVKSDEEVSGNFAYSHTKRIRNFIKEQK